MQRALPDTACEVTVYDGAYNTCDMNETDENADN